MKICVVGTGYVGLVTGLCFADLGLEVNCVDVDALKVERLKKGECPIYENGLEDILQRNIQNSRLSFTTSLKEGLEGSQVVFCAVGTPPDEDGSADLSYVLAVAREVAENMQSYLLFTTKSTVPVGTALLVKNTIKEVLQKRGLDIDFDVASNPEFLKEGSAVKDFMQPERIIVGVDSQKAKDIMTRLYHPFTMSGYPLLFMDIPSAEMCKYASNAMLATRISFMNDIANLCERLGANVDMVRIGMGEDSRIGKKFLNPGIGYGGSCFPKDVKALVKTASNFGYTMEVLEAVENVNERQKSLLFNKLKAYYGELKGKTICLWGLSFKPDTDDMREAPSLVVIKQLKAEGCNIKVYDPIAMSECKRRLGDTLEYACDAYEAAIDADAILLLTEWSEFKSVDWKRLGGILKKKLVFDGRNIYDGDYLRSLGFEYFGVGVK